MVTITDEEMKQLESGTISDDLMTKISSDDMLSPKEITTQPADELHRSAYDPQVSPLKEGLKESVEVAKTIFNEAQQLGLGAAETLGMNIEPQDNLQPQTGVGSALRNVGKVAGYAAPIPGAEMNAGNNELTNVGIKKISQNISKLTDPVANAISGLTKKTASYVQGTLSSVRPEFYEHAVTKEMSGESIFKGKWNPRIYDAIGKRVQEAVNYAKDKAGRATQAERDALRGMDKQKVPVDDLVTRINNQIESSQYGRVQTLNKDDLRTINSVKSKLMDLSSVGGVKPQELHAIKKNIQQSVNYTYGTVKKTSTEGDAILKVIADDINKKLSVVSPKYAKANSDYNQISTIKSRLLTKLKDENVARNLKGIFNKDETTQSLFKELDEIVPEELKFMDELRDAIVREPFENLFPGRGGGSGSHEGFANILRIAGIAHDVALFPLVSPAINKLGIQATGKVPGIAKSRSLKQAVINSSLNNNQGGEL
jgi:hypothetical protein